MRDLRMYILVNKDLKMSKGKMAGQVGHAVNIYTYHVMNNFLEQVNNNLKSDSFIYNVTTSSEHELMQEYMIGEIKKIVLYDSQEHMEKLEKWYTRVRDKGYTELSPNSLTCINLGILDYNDIPSDLKFIKDLKLAR